MNTRTLMAATVALALAASPASADEDALDDAIEATVVTLAHLHRAAQALHPDRDYTAISTAEVSSILDTPYIRDRVGLALTERGMRPMDGWGAGIEIKPADVGRDGKARAFVVDLVGVPGDACPEIAKAALGGSRKALVGDVHLGPKASRKAVAAACRNWDTEGEIDIAITLR